MKRRSLFTLAAMLLLLSACAKTETPPAADDGAPDSIVEDAAAPAAALDDAEVPPTEDELAAEEQTIDIDATNWAFTPSIVSVRRGDQVTLRITSLEGTHGFAAPDLGIDVAVPEGETVEITLPTDNAGTFEFRCSIPCGEGHNDMKGTITIAE